ncbi:unnamed protein product [Bursaphelenchus xylophilus]|uniref:(pine wood nematode) hypothetical protein n=1 Tax=Bursaphelenchus xylophilus TaxID=6326 RepID=A0A1I7RYD9_BURXY|nr:unnamed protein product [Bursaphelenchus xylophilus]CAG9085645.1 unnamed protein product [Bursaphelenchus xylophilus]
MYCLQFLLPVLLIPKPIIHPTFLIDHALFLWFYIIGFIISKRPCHVCLLLFFVAAFFLCYSDMDNCSLYPFCSSNVV